MFSFQLRGQLQPFLLDDVEETGRELGRGAYSVVTEVKVSGTICAGKKLHDVIVQRSTVDKFAEECLCHSQQRHPNIVQLMGVYYPPESQSPMLVMEYLPLSLRQCLEKRTELPLRIKYSILLDVAKGLSYLHRKRPPIVHRDLTANNVLLTRDYIAKISDLGVSRMMDRIRQHHLTVAPGTPIVMPPEALEKNPQYDHKLDVFSYGCLILYVLTGQFPEPTRQFVSKPGDRSSFIQVQEWERRSKYVEMIPKENEIIPFAKQCLENDPTERPEMTDAVKFMDNIALRHSSSPIDKVELLKEKETREEEIRNLRFKKETLRRTLSAKNAHLKAELQKLITSRIRTPLKAITKSGDQPMCNSLDIQHSQLNYFTTALASGVNVSVQSDDSSFMPAILIDTGTRYTKLGFAGDLKPQFFIPTYVNEADKSGCTKIYPSERGIVENWDLMEQFWRQCIFKCLQADPKDHFFILADTHIGMPESREITAEIMFEKFGVPGLSILSQGPLAVGASWSNPQIAIERSSTGLVIDCGDSGTHIVPVVNFCTVHRAVRYMPISGDDVTTYIHQLLMERGADIPKLPQHESMEVAKTIKERFSYVCPDIAKEREKYKSQPDKFCTKYQSSNTNQPFKFNLSSERFMGPEIYFSPELFNPELTVSLVQEVENAIQAAPINVRRDLYKNIVLSGGSTMFRNFGRRIQRDLKRIVTERLEQAERQCGGKIKPKPIEVNVRSHPRQRYATWFGLSMFGSIPTVPETIITKRHYHEYGPKICHNSPFPFFEDD